MKRYAGIIVKSNDRVLLCKRNADGAYPGEWSIPGGSLEKNESPREGALREFFEETTHELENKLTFAGTLTRYNRNGTEPRGMMYCYVYETNDDINPDLKNAKDGDEHTQCGYFNENEIPSPISPELYNILIKTLK